jgi:ligand-binding sensor domain-containing protein
MKRRTVTIALQIALGMALAGGMTTLAMDWIARKQLAHIPAGRQILRPPHDVNCLALVNQQVWAGGKEGLFIFSADGSAQPVPAALRHLRFVAGLLHEADGGVWIAHEDGITHWKDAAARHYASLAGAFPGRGLAVLRDRDGTLWAGSDRTLARLEGDAFQPVPLPPGLGLNEVAVLYQDRSGTLWIGDASPRSPGLVSRDRLGNQALYTVQHGLPHPSVNSITELRQGPGLWVGTGFAGAGGAVRMEQGVWHVMGRAQGLAGDKVRSLFEDSRGRLWFGSEYDGVTVMGPTRLGVIAEADGLAGPEVKAMLEHPALVFWLGTNGGLTRISGYDPQATQALPPDSGDASK